MKDHEVKLVMRLWSLHLMKIFHTLQACKLLSSRRFHLFACHRQGRSLETNPYRKSWCTECVMLEEDRWRWNSRFVREKADHTVLKTIFEIEVIAV